MVIRRYLVKCKILMRVRKNIRGQTGEGVSMNTNTLQRPCTVLKSIQESFKQIGEYKQGKRKFKSLKESQTLWNEWIEEVERENEGNDTNV